MMSQESIIRKLARCLSSVFCDGIQFVTCCRYSVLVPRWSMVLSFPLLKKEAWGTWADALHAHLEQGDKCRNMNQQTGRNMPKHLEQDKQCASGTQCCKVLTVLSRETNAPYWIKQAFLPDKTATWKQRQCFCNQIRSQKSSGFCLFLSRPTEALHSCDNEVFSSSICSTWLVHTLLQSASNRWAMVSLLRPHITSWVLSSHVSVSEYFCTKVQDMYPLYKQVLNLCLQELRFLSTRLYGSQRV